MADIQSSVQVLLLLAATEFKQPPLIGDYTQLFLEKQKDRTEPVFTCYQQSLRDLASAIAERNRSRPQPLQAFNPAILQLRVSI